MLLKNDGLILAELLISLSALLMISLFFIPHLMNLNKQTKLLAAEKQEYQLVYEALQARIINGAPSPNTSIILNGIEYQINWKNTSTDEQKEVCVKVGRNTFLIEKEICVLSE